MPRKAKQKFRHCVEEGSSTLNLQRRTLTLQILRHRPLRNHSNVSHVSWWIGVVPLGGLAKDRPSTENFQPTALIFRNGPPGKFRHSRNPDGAINESGVSVQSAQPL